MTRGRDSFYIFDKLKYNLPRASRPLLILPYLDFLFSPLEHDMNPFGCGPFPGPRRSALCFILCLVLCLVTPAGRLWGQETTDPDPSQAPGAASGAKDSEAYKELVGRAGTYFKQGKHAQALEALEQAYLLNPTPNLLYNQARILEQMGNFQQALTKYEQFVVSPNVNIEYRSEALERIKVLRETVSIQERGREPEAPAPMAKTPAVAAQPPSIPVSLPPRQSPSQNTTGIVLLISGGVLLLGGGTMGVLASREEDAKADATTLRQLEETSDRAGTFALIADGLFVGGGVLAAIGLLTFAFGGEEDATQAYTLRPVLAPHQAGVTLDFTF